MEDGFLKQAKAKAAKYCSYQERAPQQVLEKLLSWDLSEEKAHALLAELIAENFVDENRFCRAFCHDKFAFNRWGKNRIRMELQKFKLPGAVVQEGLEHIDPTAYETTLRKLAARKWESLAREPDIWKKKNKTAGYLLRKGFEGDLVWEMVNQLSSAQQ